MIAPVAPSRTSRTPPPLLSLRQAATLAGVPRRALRARVRRGEIPVRVIGKGRAAKLRLTPAALAGAGLLGDEIAVVTPDAPPAAAGDLGALLELVREQGARIAALEDQRFQLAGQFGAAVERVRALEERLVALGDPASPPAPHGTETQGRVVSATETRRGAAPAPQATANGGGDRGPQPETDRIRAVMPARSNARGHGSGPGADGGPSRAWRAGAFVRRRAIRLVGGVDAASEPDGSARGA
jgi:hypothetical protein